MNIPVLTYHGMNIGGNEYCGNDHVALASDLRVIGELGKKIISLGQVVDWRLGKLPDEEVSNAVAVSIDDGSWFDYYDLDHPTCGMQRSMFNILLDHRNQDEDERPVHITSFVISSPEARASLDRSCMIGKAWWGDQWWRDAASSGIMDIACHSWDHVHPELESVVQRNQIRGDFSKVDSYVDADVQIAKAGEYIAGVLGGSKPDLFAYPWGEFSDYVVAEYFPNYRPRHGFRAAFTIDPRPVTKMDNIWLLPRFVCGRDWSSVTELKKILSSA